MKKVAVFVLIGILVLIVVLITLAIFIRNMYFHPKFPTGYSPTNTLSEVTDSEGILTIKDNETIQLPSGSVLLLENNDLSFAYDSTANKDRDNRLIFRNKLTTYVNGFTHELKDMKCYEENKFFGDYYSNVTTRCDISYSVKIAEMPALPSYDNVSIDFDSVNNTSINRFRTLQEIPWVALSVPYFQIANRQDGSVINVVSPKEDTISLFTNYGKVDFQFDANDLNNHVTKTQSTGPLSISLTPTELTCVPPYRNESGTCETKFKDPKSGSNTILRTFNVVKFTLQINEQDIFDNYPLLLDIEK